MIAVIALLAAAVADAPVVPNDAAPLQQGLEILIAEAGAEDPAGPVMVSLRILNSGAAAASAANLPDGLPAELQAGGETREVWLTKVPDTQSAAEITAGGFAQARYRLSEPPYADAYEGAILSIPAFSRQQVVVAAPPSEALLTAEGLADAGESESAREVGGPTDPAAGNAFLDNLSAYQPIYAVYGPGTNTDARLQLSFKYRLFGSRSESGLGPSWRDGLHFAFTQKMFWDLGAESSPFRNIDYLPELFYLSPSGRLTEGVSWAAQAGMRHESNGRAGDASRSLNMIYIAPMAAIRLADDYELVISPRLSTLVGGRDDNPDIMTYRGAPSLFLEVGKRDGLLVSTDTRYNFSSGKGAFSANMSYPLNELLGGGPDLYLYGQSFLGYGENLLDYDRRTTRFRIGLAIVR